MDKRKAVAICVFIIGLIVITLPLLWNWLLEVGLSVGLIIATIGILLYLPGKKIASILAFTVGLVLIILPILWNWFLWLGLTSGMALTIIGAFLLLKGEKKLEGEKEIKTHIPITPKQQAIINAMDELLRKEPNFFVEDIRNYVSSGDIKSAEKLLDEKKMVYNRFLELRKAMNDVDNKTTKLSSRLAEGEVTSDAYERAREDLEREKRDIEEEMWKIQRKILREKYEKPF